MTKKEIIEETAAFYNLSNRAFSPEIGNCVYVEPDSGKMCAVGRCILPEKIEYFTPSALDGAMTSISHMFSDLEEIDADYSPPFKGKDLDDYLKEEYLGHSIQFWDDLQSLHDYKSYWTDEGLSYSGKIKVEQLLEKWEGK